MKSKPFMPGIVNSNRESSRRLKAFSDDPVVNAVVKTLHTDPEIVSPQDSKGKRKISDDILGKVFRRARLTGSAVNDYKVIVETQPDIKRVESLIVDGVLSPNDATPAALQFKIPSNDFPSKELVAKVTEVVQDFFRNQHKIDGRLRDYLSKILFSQGSVPIFLAPQVSVDDMINPEDTRISMESVSSFIDEDLTVKSRGILGPGIKFNMSGITEDDKTVSYKPDTKKLKENGLGLEDWQRFCSGSAENTNPLYYSVTDNPGILSMHRIGNAMREAAMAKALGPMYGKHLKDSVESHYQNTEGETVVETLRKEGIKNPSIMTENEVYRRLFKQRQYGYDAIKSVKTQSQLDRPTIGHPIEYELSSECTVPIHSPGDPQDHIGYLVALDTSGAPLRLTEDMDGYEGLMMRQRTATNSMSTILQSTYSSMMDSSDMSTVDDKSFLRPEEMFRIFSEITEKDLLERLKNGILGSNVAISRPNDLYRLMLMRALKKQHTRVLFVPKSMMTYMAYKYDPNGVGVSLLHDVRILAALRTVLLFAHVNGEIKNSLAMVKLMIELDPEDPEPEVTVEELLNHYIAMRSGGYVYGARPADIQHMLGMAGVDVEVSGHDGYSHTKVQTEDVARNVNTPNDELDTRLKEMIYSGIGGIPPELVNRADDIDFAATYIGSNIQLTKLVMNIQKPFCDALAKYVRNFTLMSSILMDKLVEVVKKNRSHLGEDYKEHTDAEIVVDLMDRLEVQLPKPKTATSEAQLAALENYEQLLDKTLENFISMDVVSELEFGDKISTNADVIRASIKARLMRDFCRENQILPEMQDIFDFQDEDDLKASLMANQEYIKRLSKLLRPMIKMAEKMSRINDRDLASVEEGDGGSDYSSDYSSDSDTGGDDFGMDFGEEGGEDDFNLDIEEEPPENTEEEESAGEQTTPPTPESE